MQPFLGGRNPPWLPLQIAQSQFDYTFAQLTSVLQSIHVLPWLLVAAAFAVVAIVVNRLGRSSEACVICPRDDARARVELLVLAGPPHIVDCSRWSCTGVCSRPCLEQLSSRRLAS